MSDTDILPDDDFSTHATLAPTSRFKLVGERQRSRAGGVVSRAEGTAKSGPLLVHTSIPNRSEQSIDLAAVATAIVHGAISYPSLVRAFAEEGKLDALKKAVNAHK